MAFSKKKWLVGIFIGTLYNNNNIYIYSIYRKANQSLFSTIEKIENGLQTLVLVENDRESNSDEVHMLFTWMRSMDGNKIDFEKSAENWVSVKVGGNSVNFGSKAKMPNVDDLKTGNLKYDKI